MSKKFTIILILVVLLGGGYGTYKYIYSLSHETTDNAQIDADVYYVIPHVTGYVQNVCVKDNQFVKKGDTLLVIDNNPYLLKVKEAKAALAIAESNLAVAKQSVDFSFTQVSTAKASVESAETNIEAAKIRVWRAQNDYKRYKNLYDDKVITKQQYEKVLAEKQAAEKQLEMIQQNKIIADKRKGSSATQAKVTQSRIKVAEAKISQAEAVLKEALLNLSYCVITAPSDGQISTVGVTQGQLIRSGQSLFNLVIAKKVWVTANFKETQITNMKVGQEVAIEVDAYPEMELHGIVKSISPATGALFSILPPNNATGNFVKIVQRVPVRISIYSKDTTTIQKLRPGLSAFVIVTTN